MSNRAIKFCWPADLSAGRKAPRLRSWGWVDRTTLSEKPEKTTSQDTLKQVKVFICLIGLDEHLGYSHEPPTHESGDIVIRWSLETLCRFFGRLGGGNSAQPFYSTKHASVFSSLWTYQSTGGFRDGQSEERDQISIIPI